MRKTQINEKWLREQYMDKKRSAQDISKELGISNMTVLRRLKSIGIQLRSAAEETMNQSMNSAASLYRDRDRLYDQYVVQGKHFREIAREIGCDDSILSDWVKRFGFEIREQIGENCHNWKGGDKSIPYYENKDCPNYLGRHIAERILSYYFEGVKMMPYQNPGYDFICKNGYKIDVKSSCLHKSDGGNPHWSFDIIHNEIADYFLCLGFDDRENLEPINLWLVPGFEVNMKYALIITFSEASMSKWMKYEKPLDKVLECCNTLKEKKNE